MNKKGKLEEILSKAEECARFGNLDSTFFQEDSTSLYLTKARKYASQKGIPLSEARLKRIEEKAKKRLTEIWVSGAKDNSKRGYVEGALRDLSFARACAEEYGIDLGDKLQEIERSIYENGYRVNLREALWYFKKAIKELSLGIYVGNGGIAGRGYLEEAKKCAYVVGHKAVQNVGNVKKSLRKDVIQSLLGYAGHYDLLARENSRDIKECASRLGIKTTARELAKIKKTSNLALINTYLAEASEHIPKCKYEEARKYLNYAVRRADVTGVNIQRRVEEIRAEIPR